MCTDKNTEKNGGGLRVLPNVRWPWASLKQVFTDKKPLPIHPCKPDISAASMVPTMTITQLGKERAFGVPFNNIYLALPVCQALCKRVEMHSLHFQGILPWPGESYLERERERE